MSNTTKPSGIVTKALLTELHRYFLLDWHGIHGIRHWGRVRTNALRLASHHGANPRVAELFAVMHDCCRLNDGYDPEHGGRGAAFARQLNGHLFELDRAELELLCAACSGHSDGHLEADVTIAVCWDADRLDLGRVGVVPDPALLCTALARDPEIIAWAMRRSIAD